MTNKRRIRVLLFDPKVGGHHGSYLGILLERMPEDFDLQLVVSPPFFSQHADLVERARARSTAVVALTQKECRALDQAQALRAPLSTAARPLLEWALLTRYAKRLGSKHAVSMYFDPMLQLSLSMRLPFPCTISGIYFRPTFHYADFPDQPRASSRELNRAARQRYLLGLALRHPALGVLFSLDRLAVPALQRLAPTARVVGLPDPVEVEPSTLQELQEFRARLRIPPDRKVALIFGMLTRRKGVAETLDAIRRLPQEQARRLTLLVVGRVAPDLESEIRPRLEAMHSVDPDSVVLADGFIPDRDVQRCFEVSDLVIAAYQEHVGSSGIQVRAAIAGKPLLGPRYGLMGELSRRHHLGPTVDSRSVSELSVEIERFLSGGSMKVDPIKQRAFGEESAGENFARVFAQALACLDGSRQGR